MHRGYFLNFIIMQTEKQKKDFELIKRMGQDFMRKRNKVLPVGYLKTSMAMAPIAMV